MLKKIANSIKRWFNDSKHAVKNFIKKQSKKTIIIVIAVLVLIIAGIIYCFIAKPDLSILKFWEAGDKKIAQKAVDFINNNGLASSTVTLEKVSRESGLIKIKIKLGTNEFDSYISKDGKFLFPNVIDISASDKTAEANSEKTATTSAASCDELTKTDNPMLEVYVVSQCPYGLQIQRAMAEAVANAPELANYIKVRYIGSTDGKTIESMHGEEEATENLRQICIREEQSAKYWEYTSCYMKAGDSASCLSSTGVDTGKVTACMSDTTRGVAYASEDFALADSNSVSGSPTLMLGNANVDESGFGGRSADAIKQIVCCASNSEAGFCSQTLNTAAAASSFSENYAGTGTTSSSADCGS